MQISDIKLINYLLGNLNEDDAQQISLRLIEDKSFEDEMQYAEAELIETFLEGSLSPEETRLFQTNFLINKARADQLREIYRLKKYAAIRLRQKTCPGIQTENPPGFFESLKAFFSVRRKLIPLLLTGLIFILIAGIAWRVIFTTPSVELTQLEKQYAEINRGDLSNSPEFKIAPIELMPGNLRSADENLKIESTKLGNEVLFRLGLPFEITNQEFLGAELLKDRKTIFTQNEVRIYKNQNGQEVKLILPKSLLAKGQYQIKLETANNEISPIIYTFVVE